MEAHRGCDLAAPGPDEGLLEGKFCIRRHSTIVRFLLKNDYPIYTSFNHKSRKLDFRLFF